MEVQAFEGKKNKFLYVSIAVGIIYYLLPMIINYGADGSKYTLHNISEIYLDGGNSFFCSHGSIINGLLLFGSNQDGFATV